MQIVCERYRKDTGDGYDKSVCQFLQYNAEIVNTTYET